MTKLSSRFDEVIHVRQLAKSYLSGGVPVPVLKGIDLTAHRGECLFLVGPSGSGKTTLLSILGCVLSADSGQIQILGEDVTGFSPREQAQFRREMIGFVFQRFHLFAPLTVEENVCVPLTLLHRRPADAKRQAHELLALVGMESFARRRITQLSMGQKQRVAVARALAGNPEIILADEPTASLDEESGQIAMSVLKDLCRSLGKTVVVVTHDSRIFPMADRILRLSHGQIVPPAVSDSLHKDQASVVQIQEIQTCAG